MDALQVWGDSKFDRGPDAIRSYFQRSGIYIFLISFACVYYLSNASLLLAHYDLGWHLAAGDLIRSSGHIPFQDPWSFTLGDRQWYNLSWLWDVIASVLFQYTKFSGLVLFVVACGAVIVGYLASACLRSGASAAAVGLSVFSACLLYPSFATPPNIYLAASPNTSTMLFCVIFYAECLKRTRCFLLPAIMVLWANLHGGFLLGFLIGGIFCGAALLRRDWVHFKIYSFAGVGCFIAIFINPLGWHIYDGLSSTLGHFVQANITEWQSYYANMTLPGSIPGILYALIFIALELRYRGSRPIPLESRLLSWLFLFLGLYQFRYMSFFFIFSTVPMALHIDRLLPKALNNFEVQRSLLAAGVIGMCALPLTFMQTEPALELPEMISEQDALYLQTHFSHARLLNHWNVGGLLIFRTHGTVPVFVDGRAATAYPDALLRDYFKLVDDEFDETAWDTVLEKYQIDAVLWVKAHEALRRFLVDKRGWKEEYAGLYETIYVKP
ncbi:hypothetical protein [Bradyrhizobium erythrophlei]|uniref:Glycosyltransferase RgtA/B/C/D-like domain-containing protein n=1 Tax=Bradyrhizobium erythrophlei TaxID=1437360 RepID=A0A1M5VK58_9BRAD|nr:hypothetical protein [Bradyrhizobium erythrophlei]SHH75662.1 hypothetical protein SAMN05443248_6020 [Bradyrhizobium erythrophlei]